MWGDDLFTTKHYEEILSRKDVDAVLIATPDHWHKQVAIDAMKAGKDVYCEKPMIHLYEDGPEMIEAARSTGRMIQIGSQRVSSEIYKKAKELLAAGAIGELNLVNARWDRNSAMGAWDYTVPLDAIELRLATGRDFWARRRRFPGMQSTSFNGASGRRMEAAWPGDLFVHLFSGTHFITGVEGADAGGCFRGAALLEGWPRCAGCDAGDLRLSGGIQSQPAREFCGWRRRERGVDLYRLRRHDGDREQHGEREPSPRPKGPGFEVDTFAEAMQKETAEAYEKKYPKEHPTGLPPLGEDKYVAPPGYSDSYDHFHNFFDSVRTRKPVVEDAVFGYRAAGAALLANLSYERDAVVHWDPEAMKLV